METRHHLATHAYALRLEGRPWLDDLSIEQAWAVLRSAYQALGETEELLFMMLLPNGEMPARCLPRALFDSCITSPAMLQMAMRSAHVPQSAPLSLVYSAGGDEG
jgi:hypothetical protein